MTRSLHRDHNPASVEGILEALEEAAPNMDRLTAEISFDYPDIDFYAIFFSDKEIIFTTDYFIRQADLLDILEEVQQKVRFRVEPCDERVISNYNGYKH